MAKKETDRLAIFKSKMKKIKVAGRGSTMNHAFASALALYDEFDEERINRALDLLGQSRSDDLRCAFCRERKAEDLDHLKGLVKNIKYTGNGHVIGNLIPSCKRCNGDKRHRPWREWVETLDPPIPQEWIDQIADYAALAPPPVSEDDLKVHYRDLMEAYERLRNICKETMKAADSIAKEIQRLERKRLEGEGFGGIADPDDTN